MPAPSHALESLVRRIGGARQLNHLVRAEPVLRLVRGTSGRTLLDVGSGSLGLAPLLGRGWSVTALDVSFDDYGAGDRAGARAGVTRAVGDVRAIPFADGAFDAVVALDLLEHVAPADRPLALAELARVTRGRLVVGCPTGDEALAADRRLAQTLGDGAPGWLAEHLENGFPASDELVGGLAGYGAILVEGNEHVESHVALTLRELSIAWFLPTRIAARILGAALRLGGWPASAAGRLLRRLRGRDAEPTYRTIVCVDRPA